MERRIKFSESILIALYLKCLCGDGNGYKLVLNYDTAVNFDKAINEVLENLNSSYNSMFDKELFPIDAFLIESNGKKYLEISGNDFLAFINDKRVNDILNNSDVKKATNMCIGIVSHNSHIKRKIL